MLKFRKKPVTVNAARISELIFLVRNNWSALPEWFILNYERGNIIICYDKLFIKTLEGDLVGHYEDWLIEGVNGEIYPCKPDIFLQTYEAL